MKGRVVPIAVFGPPSRERSVAVVVGVVSFAVFMTSLDLFVVNLAFPYIGREYHSTRPGLAFVGAQRLHDRVCRDACPGRPVR